MTMIMGFITIGSAALGVSKIGTLMESSSTTAAPTVLPGQVTLAPTACPRSGTVLALLLLMVIIAMINIASSLYIQNQVWEGICDVVDEEYQQELATGRQAKKRTLGDLILGSMGQVFCYDICFCFFFFFMIAQFAIAFFGSYVTADAACNPGGWPAYTCWLCTLYPVLVLVYSIIWWISLHCHSAMEDCCRPFGGFTCCFGGKPLPRSTGAYPGDISSDDEGEEWQRGPSGGKQQRKRNCCCCIPV
jgi:hypothetical protein